MSDNRLWRKDGYTLSTDKTYLELDVIHDFLSQSYWAKDIPRETVVKSITNTALCFGIYEGDPTEAPAAQVGFARVISDLATFAYLADVFALPAHRGHGLSKWLMRVISDHPDLQGLRRFLLTTQDAHGLYARFGFTPLPFVERWMTIAPGCAVYDKG
jgi:GNAT superfamily N-acetyltransferase